MGKIDDYYNAISDKIDRSISELTAIKNYELIHADFLDLLAENYVLAGDYFELVKDLKMAADGLKRLNIANDDLHQLLLGLVEDTTKKLVRQDVEIRRLNGIINFRRAITSDPDKVEDTRKG